MRTFLIIVRRAFINSWLDGCMGIAKGAAYSGLLSLFPVLSSLAAILVQANAERVSQYLARFAFEVVPPGAAELIERQFAERGAQPLSLIVVAVLLSAWAASSLMATLMEGFRAAYRLPGGRGIVQDRIVAFALVFISAMPAVAASAFLVFGDKLEQQLLAMAGWIDSGGNIAAGVLIASKIIRLFIVFGAVVLTTGLLYYVGPNRPQKWKYIWPGAFVATALWLAVTIIFAWYVRNLANYNVMYGSIGGVIALIVWMYLLAAIALFGCEFNAEQERVHTAPAPSTL
ncbi:MAG TPA: YihY/virulence factor BrkB family protein [Bryobacteraceae bacterium]|nr:YihY/virulence factor BrkB family protein [Bryobacteraceae bacterium]